MSHRHFAQPKRTWLRTLLLACLPLACAVGVKPELEGGPSDPSGDAAGTGGMGTSGTAGHSSGGSLPFAGSTSGGTTAKAGATSGGTGGGGGSASPFGGTSSSGGKGGGGGAAGTPAGGAAGAAGRAGTAGASGAAGVGGGGTGTCACPGKILMWMDNTVLMWGPGACFDVGGKTYLYTGTKAQTYANKDCNPTKQLSWCTDMGSDYKFMACD